MACRAKQLHHIDEIYVSLAGLLLADERKPLKVGENFVIKWWHQYSYNYTSPTMLSSVFCLVKAFLNEGTFQHPWQNVAQRQCLHDIIIQISEWKKKNRFLTYLVRIWFWINPTKWFFLHFGLNTYFNQYQSRSKNIFVQCTIRNTDSFESGPFKLGILQFCRVWFLWKAN